MISDRSSPSSAQGPSNDLIRSLRAGYPSLQSVIEKAKPDLLIPATDLDVTSHQRRLAMPFEPHSLPHKRRRNAVLQISGPRDGAQMKRLNRELKKVLKKHGATYKKRTKKR